MSSNYITLVFILLEIVLRLFPTKIDLSILSNIKKVMFLIHDIIDKIIPNNKA